MRDGLKRRPWTPGDYAEPIRQELLRLGWHQETADLISSRLHEDPDFERYLVRRLLKQRPPRKRSVTDTARYRREHPLSAAVRAMVWAKTGGVCHYCGKQTNPFADFTVDHVVPLAKGGTNELDNLVPACRRCNSAKGDRV